MPIYDIECERCHKIVEVIQSFRAAKTPRCPKCGGRTNKIISVGRATDNVVDPDWIKSVTEVVDKSPDAPIADRIFLKNPTRRNYNMWMRSRGLRPLEPGEKPGKPDPPDMDKIMKEVWQKDVDRRRLNLTGRYGTTSKARR